MMRWHLARLLALFGIAALASAVSGSSAAQDGACPPGLDRNYCSAFVHYQAAPRSLDGRIADGLGVTSSSQTRSIALIIAIDHYPHLQNADVKAAAVDAQRLTDFLINDQKFDEVILLRNEAATRNTIDYFLNVYLENRALDYPNKARLLIAYSGHGTYETGTTRPEFVLSEANSLTDDPAHVYKMSTLRDDVQGLSAKYFHVLTLINACYGGNFFGLGLPGDPDAWNEPGAYAITAGDMKTTVPSLDESRGSLFFDLLISGIQAGVADEEYFRYFSSYGPNGAPLRQDGIARTGAVENYLSTAFDRINHDRLGKDANFERLSHPWIGPAQANGAAAGGFFFLTTHKAGSFDIATSPLAHYAYSPRPGVQVASTAFAVHAPIALAAAAALEVATDHGALSAPTEANPDGNAPDPMVLPPGPVSSVKGHPEIKIFKAPEVYPVHGIDLSSADGHIDWRAFADYRPRAFMYARAIGWAGPDKTFKDRWTHYASLGVDRGGYLKFDFCSSPTAQLNALISIVPPDTALLPVALELVTPESEKDPQQFACWKTLGAEQSRTRILELAEAIQTAYGKTPLVAGNRYNLGVLTDGRFDKYMIWLYAYGKQAGALQFGGKNPWAIWQYSGTLRVKGIGPSTTGEVFFGTREQYELFKAGHGNVALAAAQ